MKFEYDAEKSKSNLVKHGLSFEQAKGLWSNPFVEFDTQYVLELRKILIGLLDGKFYTCIFTHRMDKIRIISVRRSRKSEEEIYHEYIQKNKQD